MNFFDKMYVGFQRGRYDKDENPRLLGFAVPYDTTKASKKRQETVDRWRQKDIEPRVLENKPTRGFKLLQVVSRHSTSNKLFRVVDPRGFELEISADNLLDIALASTIVKGEIIEECVWASNNGVYLMPSSDERYVLHSKQSKGQGTKITEGSYYMAAGNMVSVFRYEGIYHNAYLNVSHVADKGSFTTHQQSYYSINYDVQVDEYTTNVEINMNSGGKPVYVYTEFRLNSEGEVDTKYIHIRKSHFKNLLACDDDKITDVMKSYSPDMTQWVSDRYLSTGKSKDRRVYNTTGSHDIYFKSKEDAKNFDYSEIISKIQPIPNSYSYKRIDVSRITKVDHNSYYSYSYRMKIKEPLNAKQNFNIVDNR